MNVPAMKIAFILPGRDSSGGVRCVSLVAQRLLDRGHSVRLLYRKPERDLRDWARLTYGRLFRPGAPDWIRQFGGSVQAFGDLARVSFHPDEILVAVGMSECAQLDRIETLPNPKVQYLHGSTPLSPELVDRALRLPLPKIVVASYLKDLVASRGEDGAEVIHNGIDLDDYFASVPESQRDGVGTVYGQHPVKDPETTLSVLTQLSASRPNLPVRVFSVDRRPKQISSGSYWRHPSLARAREIYSRSRVWVVASRSEGFSMPVLEAMACGCVVVATDCGGPKDILENGANGFLVPVGDVEAILSRVQLLIDNPDLCDRMREQGLRTVRRFPWERCIDELERTLNGIANKDVANLVKTAPTLALP
jgi:glycosyltransferase involved in cell wall biosynthesis